MPRSITCWPSRAAMSDLGPFGVSAVALLLVLGSACNDVSRGLPQHEEEKFELTQDKQKRGKMLHACTLGRGFDYASSPINGFEIDCTI